MTAFVVRSLWEVPGTILAAIFLVALGIITIVAAGRLILALIITIIGAPIAFYRDRQDIKRARAAGQPIPTTYDRRPRTDDVIELPTSSIHEENDQ